MSQYTKAIAGAVTALLVYAAAEVGLDLPAGVVAALETLVTGGVVWWVRNHPSPLRVPEAPPVHLEAASGRPPAKRRV